MTVTATERRAETRARLATETFDLLIIGGGISGAGAAREAARRGLSTALVDRKDIAIGTSSRSSKLIHGGLRYLEQLELGLVFESVSERRILLDIAPHLVRPQSFLFPVYDTSRRGPLMIDLGMWLYDALSLFRSPKIHRRLHPKDIAVEEPALLDRGLRGGSLYYDCATDDARLTLETALDAAQAGAVVCTYTEVLRLIEKESRVAGVRVRDAMTGTEHDVQARAVLNATGPWTDRVRGGDPLLRPTKGMHAVFEQARLPVRHADVLLHPKDGRVMFAIPWGDRSYVGTTDTDFDGDPANVRATGDDVRYCLEILAHYYPDAKLTTDDVISTWAGVRPLIAPEGQDGAPSNVSREHAIDVDGNGLVTIAGGKLTTYRRMASEVVERIAALLASNGHARPLVPSRTAEEPLPGGVGWPGERGLDALADRVVAEAAGQLPITTARHLVSVYGGRAIALAARVREEPSLARPLIEGRAETWVQVAWACDEELAQTVDDVLCRRTQVFQRARDQGLSICAAVADRMALHLGWDAERVAREVDAYREEVARSRKWRDEITR